MRWCWGALFVIAWLGSAGCTRVDDRHVRAEREWQALCRAMQPIPPVAASGHHLDSQTQQRLQQVAGQMQRCVTWVATVAPVAPADRVIANVAADDLARPAVSVGGGTGLLIGDGRLVLTNEHVIRGATTVTVRLDDGRLYSVRASAVVSGEDLALLRIDVEPSRGIDVQSDTASSGSAVVALGGPHFPPGTRQRMGVVTRDSCSLQQQLEPAGGRDYTHLMESTTELQPGFSGGPLFDERGQLVGVNVATAGAGSAARGYALRLTPDMRAKIERLADDLLQ